MQSLIERDYNQSSIRSAVLRSWVAPSDAYSKGEGQADSKEVGWHPKDQAVIGTHFAPPSLPLVEWDGMSSCIAAKPSTCSIFWELS